MDQIGDKDKDIIIDFVQNRNKSICYNVSQFLRLLESDEVSRRRIANADKFIGVLDAKVNIDASNPRYSLIYKCIDIIVKRVLSELVKLDPFFAEVKLRRTGSSMSEVKVGLPHESDYVLELLRGRLLRTGKAFDYTTLFPLVNEIVAHHASALTEGLDGHWIIHGVHEYRRLGGVCLVMQCRSNANDRTEKHIGVAVDVVPVYINGTTTRKFTAKAEAFLHNSLAEFADKGDIYSLLTESFVKRDGCDTGIIENTIMEKLPETTKRAFRVAKYLTSHVLPTHWIPFAKIETLDKATRLRLYGRKPWITSYELRVIFLHLLLNVHGTEAEQRLKGGLLVLCIIDMLKKHHKRYKERSGNWVSAPDHPLLEDAPNEILICNPCPLKLFKNIKGLIENENTADAIEQLCLLNNKEPVYENSDDDSESENDD